MATTTPLASTHHKQKKTHRRRRPRPPRVFDTFLEMHRAIQAARYKVHKPNCACRKLQPHQDTIINGRFVVVQQTKGLSSAIFVAPFTPSLDLQEDEIQLRYLIWNGRAVSEEESSSSFKVSCAECLLLDEPNGFCCILSTRRSVVEYVRDQARLLAEQQQQTKPLHADHADHVCVLTFGILCDWAIVKKTRAAQAMVKQALEEQGITVPPTSHLEIGHHLQTMLEIMRGKREDSTNDTYWFVMIQVADGGSTYVLDLPGGKRHLGETSIEGAIRETKEETSLIVDSTWIVDTKAERLNKGNKYFIMSPPAERLEPSLVDSFAKLDIKNNSAVTQE